MRHARRALLRAAVASLPWVVAVFACRAPEAPRATDPVVPLPARVAVALPTGWDTASTSRFEELALAFGTEGPGALSGADLAALTAALAAGAERERATRAAVLLARARDPRADAALVERLERRILGPERPDDAPDVVAAAALGRRAAAGTAPGVAARLADLAIGAAPHPDLEVRVECAAAALDAGRREVAPFLVRVLRAGTPAEREDPPDWPPQRTLAWSKTRAAAALARRAGVACRFRPDGSFDDQIREAARLARLLEEVP